MKNLKNFFRQDHFAARAGVEILDIQPGYSRVRMLVTPNHHNAAGVCQGGALFTLADLAFAIAVNTHRVLTFSTSANITFVHSVTDGYVYAEAREVVNHHRMPYAEVHITNEQGDIVAVFTSSGYRKQKAAITTDVPTENSDK